MTGLYTEETLIQFYYKETDLFQTLEVEHALKSNSKVRRQYNKLISQFNLLNQGKMSPSVGSLSAILSYSKKDNRMASC